MRSNHTLPRCFFIVGGVVVAGGVAAEWGVDVLTTEAAGATDRDDEFILQRATDLGRVVCTQDRDYLALASIWQQTRLEFTGMV